MVDLYERDAEDDEENRKPLGKSFWEGIILVVVAVVMALLSVKVQDREFDQFASIGAWILGLFGIFRIIR